MAFTKLTSYQQVCSDKHSSDEFCKKYQAQLRASSHVYRITKPLYFEDMYDKGMIYSTYDTETIECVEVTIPAHKFDMLLGLLSHAEASLRSDGLGLDFIHTILEKERREKTLRHTYPAVQKAYEKYSTVLNLVKDELKHDKR